jgi:Protein of unknown function (DUF1631)
MGFVESTERPAPTTQIQIPQRHAVDVQAVVTGLGPSAFPLLIRDVSRRGMYLSLAGDGAGVAAQWITIGTAITIAFKALIDGQPCSFEVQAEIRRRDESGLGVRLVACDTSVKAALQSLVIEAMARRDPTTQVPSDAVTPANSVSPNGPAQALAECEDLLRKLGPPVIEAYLTGIEASLWQAKHEAPLSAQRKLQTLIELCEKSSSLSATTTHANLTAAFSQYHRGLKMDAHGERANDLHGLSLVESSELRAALAIADAVERIGARLASSWFDLKQRLAQVTLPVIDSSPISPVAFCFRLRDSVFDDPSLGALRAVDLTTGFSDEFVRRLDALYRAMGEALESLGYRVATSQITAQAANAGGLSLAKI